MARPKRMRSLGASRRGLLSHAFPVGDPHRIAEREKDVVVMARCYRKLPCPESHRLLAHAVRELLEAQGNEMTPPR